MESISYDKLLSENILGTVTYSIRNDVRFWNSSFGMTVMLFLLRMLTRRLSKIFQNFHQSFKLLKIGLKRFQSFKNSQRFLSSSKKLRKFSEAWD